MDKVAINIKWSIMELNNLHLHRKKEFQMIIDSHAHIGTILNFDMPITMLLESMKKYHIDFSLFSNVEGSEGDHHCNKIPDQFQKTQKEINEAVIRYAKQYPDKLGACLWIKALSEGCTEEFEQMVADNRSVIYGIKVHPFHGLISFYSPQVEEYVKLAEKYQLPVVTHTATDDNSNPKKVYEMALKYPKVNFVMVHLGLGSDNSLATELIKELPNLYGDTTWVLPEKTLKFIDLCGPDKILFGTDNPIDGVDTYANKDFCNWYLKEFGKVVSKEVYDKVMYKNAIKVFGIKR
jgi:predicted TIM-barrel fold metal-dependent hydrolase